MTWVSLGCNQATAVDIRTVTEHTLARAAVRAEEGIVGRVVEDDTVRLLTAEHRIVVIGGSTADVSSIPLEGVGRDENLTGFAGLPDGSLWTLSGWTTLVRIAATGEVTSRTELARSYTGLHSGFGRLLFQPLDFAGGTPALVTEATIDANVRPWGTLLVRTGGEPGPVRLGLSLAKCGVAASGRIPCWLAGDAAIELVADAGTAIRVPLPDLQQFVVDSTGFTNNPHRVIRDAWLTSLDLWVIARTDADEPADRRGQRGLWRFSTTGTVISRYRLPSASRLILGVTEAGVRLLTSTGDIVVAEER